MRILTTIALLLTAAAASPGDKDQEKKNTVDSGAFGIYLHGKRIGTEKFTIEQRANEGLLTAEVTVDDGVNRVQQSSELRVGGDGKLKAYKWHATVPTKQEAVVDVNDELLVEHLMVGEKKSDIPHMLPSSTVILDDNFFSERELLIWRYLATGCVAKKGELQCGAAKFTTLVPRQHLAGSVSVELLGRDKTTVKGVERELNKVKLDAEGVPWLIWVDDPQNGYKVVKISIPSAQVEVLRD